MKENRKEVGKGRENCICNLNNYIAVITQKHAAGGDRRRRMRKRSSVKQRELNDEKMRMKK